ncbi:MAG: hypothetical protein WDA15_07425 [Trueperaceae bacterium]
MRITPRRRARAALLLLALLALFALPTAFAQVCRAELITSLADTSLERPPTGIDAALALKQAIDLVEPALPPLRTGTSVPLAEDHPYYPVARYLADRRLLPNSWQPDHIDAATWATMLSTFLSWYKLSPVQPGEPATADELVKDLSAVLARVSDTIRPAALLATDPANGGRTVFWAIIWNWTIYPRLLVLRPTGDSLAQPRDVLPRLSNCAVAISAYISAPQDTAQRLFLTHNTSRMYLVAATPGRDTGWPVEVPPGEELEAFVYRMPGLRNVDVYAAVFDGPSVGFGTLMGMLPRIRTNISVFNLNHYLQTP